MRPRSRRCLRVDIFRATLNQRVWSASICSAVSPNHLRYTVMFDLCPPAIHNGSMLRARASPSPFQVLPKFWPKALQIQSRQLRFLRECVTAFSTASERICWLTLRSVSSSLRASTPVHCWAVCETRGTARSVLSRSLSRNSAARRKTKAPLAAQVCERYGARHVVRHLSQQEFVQDLPAILEAMDQPSIDGVNTWFVSKAAKEAGLKVVISGLGGDELLGGYPSFVDVPRWRRRFGALAGVPGLGLFARTLIGRVAPAFSHARPKALGLLEHSGTWAGAYLLRRGLFLPHELPEVMDPEIAREGMHRLRPLRCLGASLKPDPGSDVARVCVLESVHYMRNQLLRDADWAGMAHSLEIRVPLVDFTLLGALASSIPAITKGAGKAALAAAPTTPLPNEVVTRAKSGFAVPTGAWIKSVVGDASSSIGQKPESKGIVSRRWSQAVLNGAALAKRPLEVHAS